MSDPVQPVKHGARWRVRAATAERAVALENEGVFDELVVDDWLHIEKMDVDAWWMRVGDARIVVTLDPSGAPTVEIQRAFYGAQRGSSSVYVLGAPDDTK